MHPLDRIRTIPLVERLRIVMEVNIVEVRVAEVVGVAEVAGTNKMVGEASPIREVKVMVTLKGAKIVPRLAMMCPYASIHVVYVASQVIRCPIAIATPCQ